MRPVCRTLRELLSWRPIILFFSIVMSTACLSNSSARIASAIENPIPSGPSGVLLSNTVPGIGVSQSTVLLNNLNRLPAHRLTGAYATGGNQYESARAAVYPLELWQTYAGNTVLRNSRAVVDIITQSTGFDGSLTPNITDQQLRTTIAISPDKGVPNQTISISGGGFTNENDAAICQSAILVGEDPAQIHPKSVAGSDKPCGRGESFIRADRNGSFSALIIIPTTYKTLDSGGRFDVTVTDTSQRTASTQLTIMDRDLSVSPSASGAGSTMTIDGSGFPADNSDSNVSPNNTVTYQCSSGCYTATSVTSDTTGSFRETLRVPADVSIPSDNTIEAAITNVPGLKDPVVASVKHQVPPPTVILSPPDGTPGTSISLTGQGFPRFTQVESMTLGTADITPSSKPNTDASGSFSFDFLVPKLDPGVYPLTMVVGITTASTTFPVIETKAPAKPVLGLISPTTMSFQGVNPANQTFSVQNTGSGIMDWSVSNTKNWLKLSPLKESSTGEADLVTVNIVTSGLAPGTYADTITVTAPGAATSPQTITVNLDIPIPTVTPDPNHGTPGKSFRVTGLDFPALPQKVSLTLGSNDITPSPKPSTDSNGGVTFNATVPGLAAGQYSLILTVGTVTAKTLFTVDQLAAPPAVLSVSPTQLIFKGAVGGANPDSQSFTVRNTGGGSMGWSATKNESWLTVSPSSGSSTGGPGQEVTVAVSTTGMAPGNYTDTITVTAPGATNSPQRVTVNLEIPIPTVTPDRTNGAPSDPISINGQDFPRLTQVAAMTLGSIDITPSPKPSTDSNGNFSFTFLVPNLDPGVYPLTMVVGISTATTTFTVLETVVPQTPVLSVTPIVLNFRPGNPNSQVFTVQNAGGGNMNWSATRNQSWLTVSPSSGSSTGEAGQVTVGIITAGLSAGNYTDTITVTATGASNSPQLIRVSLDLVAGPRLTIAEVIQPIPFGDGTRGRGEIAIQNSGGGNMDWSASKNQSWLTVSPSGGSSSGEVDRVTVEVNGAGMGPGTYTDIITVRAPDAINPFQTVPFQLVVPEPPPPPAVLSAIPAALEFRGTVGGPNPASQTITVQNTGGGSMNWTVSHNLPWLSVDPSRGGSSGEVDLVSVNVNTANLTSGTHSGIITVSAPGAVGDPQTAAVNLVLDPVVTPEPIPIFAPTPSLETPPTSATPTLEPTIPVPVSRTYVEVEITAPALLTGADDSTTVTVTLTDAAGSPVVAQADVVVPVTTTLGALEEDSIRISKGGESGATTLTADARPGIAVVTASLNGFSSKETVAFVDPMQDPVGQTTLDFVIDRRGVLVGHPLESKVILLDETGRPVPADQDYPLRFRINPIDIKGADVNTETDGNGAVTGGGGQPPINLAIGNLDTIVWSKEWSRGPLTIDGVLQKGQLAFSFKIKFIEPSIVDVSLDVPGLVNEKEVVVVAKPGTPDRLWVIASPDELKADGNSQSNLTAILVDHELDPVCPVDSAYVREIFFDSTLGSSVEPKIADLITVNCNTRTDDEVTLTSSTRAGGANVMALSTGLQGARKVLFKLVAPSFLLLFSAGAGGIIGSLLKIYRDRLSFSDARMHLTVGIAVSEIFYLALYYFGTTILPIRFYQHEIFAALMGALAGYVGLPAIDLIVDKLGMRKKTDS